MKKLKSNAGETIVEVLFAMLVVVLSMSMLAGAIVSAAKVNKSTENLNTAFRTTNVETVTGVKVTVDRNSAADSEITVINAYQTNDKNKYCYYTEN